MSATDFLPKIKEVLVDECMLQVTAAEIADEAPIFGPDGLGLDSVDALQIVVALDKHFGLKVSDGEAAKGILRSPLTIAEAIVANRS